MIAQAERAAATTPSGGRDVLGHPRGLAVLFATEAWERFSYFGNAALVVLYMTKYLLDPGRVETVLGLDAVKAALEFLFGRLEAQPLASQLFGFYTGLAYFTPILGGLVADRLLGQHRTVVIGGVFMAIGHFMMAFEALFLLALLMLIVGIGPRLARTLVKNVSLMKISVSMPASITSTIRQSALTRLETDLCSNDMEASWVCAPSRNGSNLRPWRRRAEWAVGWTCICRRQSIAAAVTS